jgi:hypothetical protein
VFGNYGYFTSVAFASSSYDHCTWDQSQTVNFSEGGTNGTGSLTITGASITNTTSDNSSYGTLHFATKPSLGVRTFGNSYIEGGIFFDQVTGGVVATNLAFANLLFRPAATGYFGIAAGHGAVAAQINADQVLVYNDTTNDRSSGGPAGSQTHWYIARYDNSTDGNQHTFYPATGIGATYTGLVAEANTPGTEPDFINPAGTGTKTGGVPAPFVIQNSLLLCRGDGKPPSSFINDQQGIDGNEAMTYTNNTYCTAYSSAPPGNPVTDVHVIGIGWECGNCGTTSSTSLTVGTGAQSLTVGSNITLPVGNAIQIVSSINSANAMFGTVTSYSGTSLVVNITSVTGSGTFASWNVLGSDVVAGAISAVVNNLAYRLDSVGVVEIMCSDQQAPQPGTATLVSNNAAYNATNGVTNYCSTSTVGGRITTGPQNDLVFQRSPAFLSTTRMLISFDTDYLGNPLSSTTWTSGNVYNAGDLVQDSQGSVYGGKAFNWRAKATCTASSANRPYSGTSAFVACWEPAAMALIKASVRSSGNNTYTGALGGTGLSLIGALNEWVRQGYTPTGADATALATAGVGGIYPSWIGAIQATTPSSSSVLSGSINLSGGVVVH